MPQTYVSQDPPSITTLINTDVESCVAPSALLNAPEADDPPPIALSRRTRSLHRPYQLHYLGLDRHSSTNVSFIVYQPCVQSQVRSRRIHRRAPSATAPSTGEPARLDTGGRPARPPRRDPHTRICARACLRDCRTVSGNPRSAAHIPTSRSGGNVCLDLICRRHPGEANAGQTQAKAADDTGHIAARRRARTT